MSQADPSRRPTLPRSPATVGRSGGGRLLAVAIVVTAFNLRTAVTSIGALLAEVDGTLGLPGWMAGLLTSLPVICFAVLGSLAPLVARRVGERPMLAAALALMAAGVLLRAVAGSALIFLVCTLLALAGGAAGNVLLPTLVKRYFPTRVGALTGAYTTSLAVGATFAAAFSVPIARAHPVPDQGWRLGLGVWALPALVAVVLWLGVLRRRRRSPEVGDRPGPARPEPGLLRSPLAWAMTVYFGAQSLQAYVVFGWFGQFFREAGLSGATAGLIIAFVAALSVPISTIVPALAARMRNQRLLSAVLAACSLVGYLGMLWGPLAGAWWWALLVGIGGGAFPLALTMIGLHTRTPAATAQLSAFAQSIGYLMAASGPLLVGVLHDATGRWAMPFGLLFVALTAQVVSGWYAGGAGMADHQRDRATATE